ncbi:DUF3857 domain-containing protein [Sphingomonas sp. PAMC 26605]|uniref:DUF3857 domain-containing protein n=1 Tax=Sphingomonas sp. PAMC 26605 TaxID=1112214 RepID=UPI00026CDDC5|nr:DUF3857 domain-containing protein [Sphingomonas sp. PAMC 26605]
MDGNLQRTQWRHSMTAENAESRRDALRIASIRRGPAALVAALLLAGGPAAAKQPTPDLPASFSIAPAPAWITRHAIPADNGSAAAGGITMLLRDNQAAFDADGATTIGWDDATKVVTPDGLSKAANLAIAWNPETERLAIHRVLILRGTQTIDVLATQHFTILHRETNLERAAIDGRLTASLQIAGLQIGDVVEVAASRRHLDPAMAGHHEAEFLFPPTARDAALDARWPAAAALRWRAMPGLPTPAQTTAGGVTRLSMRVPDLREPELPKGAPPRFRQADVLQFSDWSDWSELSAVIGRLFDRAATPLAGGPVAAEAARIAAASPDPVLRAQSALRLVQDQVRYLFVGLNDGGYVPAAADETWQRRYGDCKGKTVLLLALLKALGISAQPVLVNTNGFGDAIPRYLPAAGLFNHVLVRATIAGRSYWLDGTRLGDRRLADIRTPAFRWGLPLQARGAALVAMMPEAPTQLLATTSLRLDASGGVDRPVPAHAEFVTHGDGALGLARTLGALTPEVRDRALRAVWRKEYDFVTPSAVSARFDSETGTETIVLDGTATLDWQDGALELTNIQLGGSVDYARSPGLDADAPFAVAFPTYSEYRETIVLPDHGRGFLLDPVAFDATIAGMALHRAGAISDGVVTLVTSRRSLAPEFPAAQAPDAQQALRRLQHQHSYLRRKVDAKP